MRQLPTRVAATLPADSFSIVMATGIVSIAGYDTGYPLISYALEMAGLTAFTVLLMLIGLRLSQHGPVLAGALRSPTQIFGCYTFVAACDVLDARFLVGSAPPWLLVLLGVPALAGWLSLVPLTWRAMRSVSPRDLRTQARGSWMLAAVGTQSLAIITTDFAMLEQSQALLGWAIAWWVLGMVVYLGTGALIGWRIVAERIHPDDVTPDSWVLMGALAIAALAGGTLLEAAQQPFAFDGLTQIMMPATMAVWICGSLWIPPLVAGEVWRAARGSGVTRYDRARWATVFPLGMYAVASHTLARGWPGPMPSLLVVSQVFFWAALVLWCVTSLGLLRLGLRRLHAGSTK